MSFHVGQRVVCVDADGAPSLTEGVVYTIAKVLPPQWGWWCSRDVILFTSGLLLHEAALPPGVAAFASPRFRPVDESRLDIFRALLNKTPEPISSPVQATAGEADRSSRRTSPAVQLSPDPRLLAAADGRPSIPSDPAAGAKSDGLAGLSSVGAGAAPEFWHREGSQAVTQFEPESRVLHSGSANCPGGRASDRSRLGLSI